MSNSTTPDRSLLGFQEAVNEHFEFITTQYGYKCIFSDPYCVKFKSALAFLNVYHERISYEIYLEIGILPEDYKNPLKADIRDIILNSSNVNVKTFYQASNKNDIKEIVKQLAKLINLFAKDALNGSINYFKSVSDRREQRQQKALLLQELRVVEEKAKIAWSCKDYNGVVEAYEHYEKYLDPVQLKRLHYARKMLSNNEK